MHILKKSLVALLVTAPLLALAAEPPPPPPGQPMGMAMHHDRGKRCEDMKGHGPQFGGHSVMIPTLPPGNEKQQLLMQAEIQQKVAEIITKYAQQLP
jgi:hypothetical protein